MDNNEYNERKNRVRKLESEFLDMCMDMNYAETVHIHDIKSKLYQIEADCMAIGAFYQQCGTKEEIDSKYRKVLEAQESAIKQNIENDNRRTEIAEEQVKNQLRGIELQSELQKNADASELKTLKHRETIEKQNQHMLTALESIAYSLAKIQVRLDNEQDIIGVVNSASNNNEVSNEEHLTEKFTRLVAEEINNGDILYYLHLNDINNIIIGLVTHENNVTFYVKHPIGKLLYKTMKYVVVPVYDSDGNRLGCIIDMMFAKRVTPEEVNKQFEKDADDSDKIYLYDDLMKPVAVVLERSIKDLENKNMSSERYIKLIDTNLEHDEDYHNHGINVYNDKHDDIGVIRNGKLYPHARIVG